LLGDGEYDGYRILWITDNVFVCIRTLYETMPEELPGSYREAQCSLCLWSGHRYITLVVGSSTLQEAMLSLDLLFGLRDHHYDHLHLTFRPTGNARHYGSCPLTNDLSGEILVQSSKRLNQFNHMDFTPGQCRILATSGTRTNARFKTTMESRFCRR
jgi:hypothetical protein